jgi:serine/threonine-protein kinase
MTARELHDALERFLDGDRDLEQRRALSDASVERAEAAFATAKAGGDGALAARAEAMREVGRALAFAPDNGAALALFGRLVAEPPERLPDDAEAELTRENDASERRAARNGAFGYLAMLLGFALVTTLGIRWWTPAILHVVFAGAACLLSWVRSRAEKPPPLLRWLSLAFGLLAVAMLTRVFGSLLVAPGLASAVGVAFAVYVRGRARVAIIAASVLGVMVPAALELCGVVPPSLLFENGALVVPPQMTHFPVGPTLAALSAIAVATVGAPAVLVGRTSDALVDLKRRYSVREWQLRQLVPAKPE